MSLQIAVGEFYLKSMSYCRLT